MSKFIYQNIAPNQPRISRDPKGEDDVFLAEFEIHQKDGAVPKKIIYRAGKAPEWVEGQDETTGEDEGTDLLARKKRLDQKLQGRLAADKDRKKEAVKPERRRAAAAVVVAAEDEDESTEQGEEKTERKVPTRTIEIKMEPKMEEREEGPKIDTSHLEIQGEDSEEEEEEDKAEQEQEDEASSRRARARQKFQQRQVDEKTQDKEEAPAEPEEEEEGEGDSSEYETDTDDDDYLTSSRPLLKPVFVSKKARQTVEERKRLEADKQALEDELETRAKERKKQSRMLVIEEVKREEEMAETAQQEELGEEVLPPDDDDENDDEEFQKWKIRELMRIKRDKEKQEEYDKDQAMTEKRREMTDEQIIAANRTKNKKDKVQMRFLQKYYHKGSYYIEEDEDVLKRNFMEPTLEDRTVDRTLLPKVLQVKKFGLKGRTKYTHLVDQDTTQNNNNPFGHGAPDAAAGVQYGILPNAGVTKGPQGKRMAGTGAVTKKKPKT